jgi:hypothetical protein
MRHMILIAAIMATAVSFNMMSWSLIIFTEVSEEHTVSIFGVDSTLTKDGELSSRNVCNDLPYYMPSHPRTQYL